MNVEFILQDHLTGITNIAWYIKEEGQMAKNEFTLEIDQLAFVIEIVKEESGGFFLFCKPCFEKHKFFFMNKDKSGNWKIQYRDTVSKNILALETLLTEKITEVLKIETRIT